MQFLFQSSFQLHLFFLDEDIVHAGNLLSPPPWTSLCSKHLSNIGRGVGEHGKREEYMREARAARVSILLHCAPKIAQAPATQAIPEPSLSLFEVWH